MQAERPSIVWLRLDLRLADNAALNAAIMSSGPVIPVYIWSPEDDAPWPPGAASKWWLHESLQKLQADLAARGSRLIVRRGAALEALTALAAETNAQAVFWNRRYDPAGIACDTNVKTHLRQAGLRAESSGGALLFEPWELKNAAGNPFQVFTAYWKATQRDAEPGRPLPAPERIQGPSAWPHSLELDELQLQSRIDWASGFRSMWTPGERGAIAKLKHFEPVAPRYAELRDSPSVEGTSRLSPHLHFGEVSARQVWHATEGADSYRRQLIWREFAHYLLFHFPHTATQPLRPAFREFPWRMDAALFERWTQGNTGYPLVDAGMRELWHTGWMHNRVRMVVASFLVKHLLMTWQEGAAWFWDTLVDADLANNTMGWQWAAGCGADAAPYFRIFNPTLQQAKFDPQGSYVRQWVPAPAAEPIVDHAFARARALAALASIRERS